MTSAAPMQTRAARTKSLGASANAGLLLQQKCACRSPTSSLSGECAECKSKKILQTKLAIGASNDPQEQEADRVAGQVLAAPANPAVKGAPPHIQRFAGEATGQAASAPASVDRVLASPGKPLDPALRQDMEQRFGHDFSRVRVHSGGAAEQSARDVNAHAYTVGDNIVFDAGRFEPGTLDGRRLILHELTHVVQQSRGGPYPPSSNEAALEQDASSAARSLAAHQRPIRVTQTSPFRISRETKVSGSSGGPLRRPPNYEVTETRLPNGNVRIRVWGTLGDSITRLGLETYYPLPKEIGLNGYDRWHLAGPDTTGTEEGIVYTPKNFNISKTAMIENTARRAREAVRVYGGEVYFDFSADCRVLGQYERLEIRVLESATWQMKARIAGSGRNITFVDETAVPSQVLPPNYTFPSPNPKPPVPKPSQSVAGAQQGGSQESQSKSSQNQGKKGQKPAEKKEKDKKTVTAATSEPSKGQEPATGKETGPKRIKGAKSKSEAKNVQEPTTGKGESKLPSLEAKTQEPTGRTPDAKPTAKPTGSETEISPHAIESSAGANQEATAGAVGGAAVMIHQGQIQNLQEVQQTKADNAFKKIEPEVDRLVARGQWVVVRFHFDAPRAPSITAGIFKEQSDINHFVMITYHHGDTKNEALGQEPSRMMEVVGPPEHYEAPMKPLGADRTTFVSDEKIFQPHYNTKGIKGPYSLWDFLEFTSFKTYIDSKNKRVLYIRWEGHDPILSMVDLKTTERYEVWTAYLDIKKQVIETIYMRHSTSEVFHSQFLISPENLGELILRREGPSWVLKNDVAIWEKQQSGR